VHRCLSHYTFNPLSVFILVQLSIVMGKSDSIDSSIVSHIVYRVPKKNHDAMLQICKEAYDMLKQHGILHYDAFKLSNTDVPMEGFANIASIVSANHDEEVWIESIYYRDRQHMKEVMKKMEKDERTGQMMKQSMDLLPQGAKFIVGDFERLNV
jgi:uncharacterized protein YbaA (DUF1428 family)